jgi:hypothetical protein
MSVHKPLVQVKNLISLKKIGPRPWTSHDDGGRHWIEDNVGTTIAAGLEPNEARFIVACVNYVHSTGIEADAILEANIKLRKAASDEG